VQETIAAGDKVVQIVTVTGKHTGNFFVIPPTGNNISYQAVHIYIQNWLRWKSSRT
jgi:nogalonic acid methyl ester cyclase / aklanonic acid methyl ester cyclase